MFLLERFRIGTESYKSFSKQKKVSLFSFLRKNISSSSSKNRFVHRVDQKELFSSSECPLLALLYVGSEKYLDLAALTRDFNYAAETFGKIIISEMAFPGNKNNLLIPGKKQ